MAERDIECYRNELVRCIQAMTENEYKRARLR